MSRKGPEWERTLCRRLSEWLTDGKSDDVLWRSANSGGRATTRRKAGKQARQHNCDIAATDPCAFPLTELLVLEAKRGYPKAHLGDVLDRREHGKSELVEWCLKAEETQEAAQAWAWLVIHRRDGREALVYFPTYLWDRFRELGAFRKRSCPRATFWLPDQYGVCVVFLEDFLAEVPPEVIRQQHKAWRLDRGVA